LPRDATDVGRKAGLPDMKKQKLFPRQRQRQPAEREK